MTDLPRVLPPKEKHCGAVTHLRVHRQMPDSVQPDVRNGNSIRIPHRNRISLYIGEVAASHTPVLLDTLLGSCVAVCMFDPALRAGGMNHILLSNCRAGDTSPRCGVHAMELLINELMKLGGDRRRFVAKAFGGANVLASTKIAPIGDSNARFVRSFLAAEKIPLIAERLGGMHAVHLYFHTDTGKASVHTVDGSRLPKIIDSEGRYCKPVPPGAAIGGEITLF